MRRIIVNADDFGYNTGVNAGVVEAARAGALTSTTLMAPSAAFDDAVRRASEVPRLGVGCHVCLVGTRPVSPPEAIPSLVGRDGRFLPSLGAFARRCFGGGLREDEMRREVEAQVEKVIRAGHPPTHLDAHKHVFVLARVHRVLCGVCRRYAIPAMRNPYDADPFRLRARAGNPRAYTRQWLLGRLVRVTRRGFSRRCAEAGLRTPDRFFGVAATGLWSPAYLDGVFAELADGVNELMVHPAVMDESMRKSRSRLRESRGVELRLLLERVPGLAASRGVALTDYSIFAKKES
ncbi:MAG: ChbG/HpnK family deacetylase [Acidobacteria bacterium]|nr:ChbG/HpnK family deacetylase [Acidobacteriota bacterium]